MKSKIKRILSASLAIMLVLAVGANLTVAQNTGQGQVDGETVVDKLSNNDNTSDFAALVEESGFGQVLVQQGPYTVLAPTNEALAQEVDVQSAKQNKDQAQQVVQSHLYQGEISSEEVENSMGVGVKDQDGSAANGIVYVVDQVVTR